MTLKTLTPEVVSNVGAARGECPAWNAAHGRLDWTDLAAEAPTETG